MLETIRIGLHAQSLKSSDGTLSGSEITTKGLKNAFLKKENVKEVIRFGPSDYGQHKLGFFDLIIIEGWHVNVPMFIQLARESNANVIILFWNLSFFGFENVIHLNVDGYLCNSRKNVAVLNKLKPSLFLMLAADIDEMSMIESNSNLASQITYLGMYHPSKSQATYDLLFTEATKFDFSIYGKWWDRHVTYSKYWKGILPINQIAELYNSSKIILGTTEDRQRNAGMINNRIFEVLACGGNLISDYFIELENEFGDLIYYSKHKGDTTKHIENILLKTPEELSMMKSKKRAFIKEHHSYDKRVESILDFYLKLKS